MKRALCLLILVLPLLAYAQRKTAAATSSGPFKLVSVKVTGAVHFAEADIIAVTGLKVGAEVTPEQFRTAADALSATGAFAEVHFRYGPAGKGFGVEFRVVEAEFLPTQFDNFLWFTDQQLMEAIRARLPLFRGEVPAEGEMAKRVTDILQDLLKERALPGQVEFRFAQDYLGKPISSGVFSIDGVNARIQDVSFPGADPDELPQLEAASRKLLESPYQRSAVYSYAERNLLPIYLQRGYLKARLGEPEVRVVSENPREPVVTLSLPVTPGLQYRLGAIRWTGNKVVPSLELQESITARVGEPANLIELRQNLDSVHALYASRGYLRQTTREVPTLDDSSRVASFELQVSEGAQYKFATLQITGLKPEVRDLVREEWTLREGEPYDPGHLKQFLARAIPLMQKGAVTRVQQDINDETQTVEVLIHFDFQKPVVQKPRK